MHLFVVAQDRVVVLQLPNCNFFQGVQCHCTRRAKLADSKLGGLPEFGAGEARLDRLLDEIEFLFFQQNPYAHLARMRQWLNAHEDDPITAISDDAPPQFRHVAGVDGQVHHETLRRQQRTRPDRVTDVTADSRRSVEVAQRTIRRKCPARNRKRCSA